MTTQNTKATAGRAMIVALLLLTIGGAGGYNYHRNFLAEQAEQGARPFKGYARQDLVNLGQAYGLQVEGQRGEYDRLASRRLQGRSGDMLDENIADFERIQRASDRKRVVAGEVAGNQARLAEIEAELAYRDYTNSGLALHISRLTKL